MINIYNMDCMELLANTKDKVFDLAIVDPPYGIGADSKDFFNYGTKYGKAKALKSTYVEKDWDKQIPSKEYFKELLRVSRNQIIWGGNYFANLLPNKSGWVFWDKNNGNNCFSDGELAWTSFDKGLRKIQITWHGMLQHDMKNKETRIHPTQNPVALYSYLLKKYAKQGYKILDTHLGSASIAIACHDLGFDLEACELDKDYFQAAKDRLEQHKKQLRLF